MNDLLLPLPTTPVPCEQRRACLLVADVVGSTTIAHRLPLAHYGALMTELVQLMYLHFSAHGGQVLQHQGDGVVVLWDANDVSAALHAGLGIHGRAGRLRLASLLGEPLRLRVGLALGEVLMLPLAGQPSAYGLPVNLASRLAAAAESGETLACPSVRRQLERLQPADVSAGPPLQVREAQTGEPQAQELQTQVAQAQALQTRQGLRLSARAPLMLAGFGTVGAYAATRTALPEWRDRGAHGSSCPTVQQMKVS